MKMAEIFRMAAVFERIVRAGSNPSAGYLLFCPDDQTVLLTRRAKEMSSPGTWDIPGGRFDDKDDSVEETAAREVHEEIGSLPKNKKLIGKHILPKNEDHKNEYVIFIQSCPLADKKVWKPTLSDESDNYKWFPIDELPEKVHFDLSWIPKAVKNK